MSADLLTSNELVDGAFRRRDELDDTTEDVFSVTATFHVDAGRTPLLTAGSILQRRNIDVVEAHFGRVVDHRQTMTVTIRTTPRRAHTLLESLLREVYVLEARLA